MRAVIESLNHLAEDKEVLAEAVETAVEKATIAGDLLELGQVTTDDPEVKGSWIFAAPPAFVAPQHTTATVVRRLLSRRRARVLVCAVIIVCR